MKSSDLPILQFFSKTSSTTTATTLNENAHDLIEDIDPDDEDEDNGEEEYELGNENREVPSIIYQNTEDLESKSVYQDDDDSNTSTTTCPLCHKLLLGDNDKINKHIDLCLNGEMVRTTIKEEDQRRSPQTNLNKR